MCSVLFGNLAPAAFSCLPRPQHQFCGSQSRSKILAFQCFEYGALGVVERAFKLFGCLGPPERLEVWDRLGSSGRPNKGMDREALLAQSKAADERVLALLREKPMRPSEIAKATRAKLSTTRERLRRLRKRGV